VPTHKEVGAILQGALAAIATPFALVDIACGDAGQMKAALAGTKAKHVGSTIVISSRLSPSGPSPPTPLGAGFRFTTSRPKASVTARGHPWFDIGVPDNLRADPARR
jgi:hypothetical protein